MTAVEDVVEDIHIAAHYYKCKHEQYRYLFPYLYAEGQQEYAKKQHRKHSAGKVRESVNLCRRIIRKYMGDDLLPVLIERDNARHGVIGAVGHFKSIVSRQENESAKTDAKHR